MALMKSLKLTHVFNGVATVVIASTLIAGAFWVNRWIEEERILREMIDRLSRDTRIAEVLVTRGEYKEETRKVETTIKFLEYDVNGEPLLPKYFTFQGNIIQFQSLVIRFDDKLVKMGDRLRGKSGYLFMKAFVLDGENTQSFNITQVEGVPAGYRTSNAPSVFEQKLWEEFWRYALDPEFRERSGIKNAQIEAPGSMFLPGSIYTLHIEHDGGLRIDAKPVPEILKGEKL
ncbi:MAG: hypothetical protein Q8R76_09060 [Candidatus Omnitrophota bacterium]|nr:hypothetical protein [Candidatus Omnitrophota bacterium]